MRNGPLDGLEHGLTSLLRVVLWASAAGVLILGTLMIRDMDASSRSQGGVFYVGAAMVILLVVIGGKLVTLSRRGRR